MFLKLERARAVLVILPYLLLATPLGATALGADHPDRARGKRGMSSSDSSLLVLAASSLTDVLPRVAQLWTDSTGVSVRFSFGATSRLAPQTLQGAPADLFFSADPRWMDWVSERGGIQPASRVALLGNGMVLVVPRNRSVALSKPGDLIRPAIRHIAMAGENVPAGRYGKAALEAGGVWEDVAERVVRAGNVRGALEWVAVGEADVGVVYRTDAAAEGRVETALFLPAESHPPITYSGAVLAHAPLPVSARAFLDFCRSERATQLFQEAGFRVLEDEVQGVTSPTPGTAAVDPPAPAVRAAASSEEVSPAHPNPWSAIRLSFLVALAATLAGFLPAVWLGWVLARKEFFGKSVIATVVLVPLVLPPVVTGFILLSLLGSQGPLGSWLAGLGLPIPFTLLGATLAALTVGLPLYVVSVRNAFQSVDPSYEEVAWTLGHRPCPTFLKVSFPLALPGVAAGAVLAFARALGEFGATVVLAGNIEGSTRTIALAVYTLLESPQGRESIWVLVGASVVLSLMALLGFEALSRRQRRQMEVRRER